MATQSTSKDSFVHLHGHSHYSLLDGGATIPGLCEQAKAMGMPALALTDHGNLFGLIEFYNTANAAGIKPIIGCEFYVAPGSRFEKESHGISDAAYHLVVLACSQTGYRNMLKLASIAYTEGFYYRPRVDKESLARFNEGLVVINGHFGTEISACLERNDLEAAVQAAGQYKDIFGDRFYVELQNHADPAQIAMIPQLLQVAKRVNSPIVATNDHHYLLKEDYDAHDVLCCISMGKQLSDANRLHYSRELYLKSPAEMRQIFKDLPEACDNTLRIAEMCDVKLDFSKRHAPVYHPPKDEKTGLAPSADDYLRQLCLAGIVERYGSMTDAISARLEQELKVIQSKGFSSYFLIVWDFCNYARKNGIPVGARGSGVGTLVGYVLGLCNVDPLRYDLLFERFMDPSRSEMPDIDIDICQEGRGKVIEYVREKYGNVSQIITFSTLGAKAAIKDVGRVLAMPLSEVDKLTKLVPSAVGTTLDDCLRVADFKRLHDTNADVLRLFQIAKRLEGLCRNAGMHAAGVIVCDKPLDEVVPLYKKDNDIMTQWDGPTCEKMGLLKMDFLGLRTLTIVERALQLIEAAHPKGLPPLPADTAGGKAAGTHPSEAGRPGRLDIEHIDLTDQRVYRQIFQKGQTRGVFQFESPGMRELLIKMKPDRIEDLIAANALFRPGPMELIPAYCDRKHGKAATPKQHPIMDKILEETYGIMVYQEQVMRICNQLGNIPLARAYKLIKAISKKNVDTISAERKNFLDGAGANGVAADRAAELFGLIEEFGKYGFNKSHSTRYALVAFQTAYLKTYFPLEFMAALLTFEMVDADKTADYLDECRSLLRPDGTTGIAILPPDINLSESDFAVVDGTIRFGLGAVKGVGSKAVEAIVAGRVNAKTGQRERFRNIFDFCERVDMRPVNKGVMEALIKSGAFDSVHDNRAAAMAALESAMQAGAKALDARKSGQESLFGGGDSASATTTAPSALPKIADFTPREKMSFEKAYLGFYVSSHPLRDYEELLEGYATVNSQTIQDPNRREAIVGGLVSKFARKTAKTGRNAGRAWASFSIEDLTGSVPAVLFSDEFEKYQNVVKPETVLFFKGVIDRQREEPSLRVTEIYDPQQVIERLTKQVLIQLHGVEIEPDLLGRLDQFIKSHQGPAVVPLKLEVVDSSGPEPLRVQIALKQGISLAKDAKSALQTLLPQARIRLLGPRDVARATQAAQGTASAFVRSGQPAASAA
ncbi:MAG: DNA polymerase III subunit alpha [Phycisphaerae bacterium]